MDPLPGDRPPLTADEMLGTLAKWLRAAGVDCTYARHVDDEELLEMAGAGRLVLTRDRLLAQRLGPRGLYIVSDELEEQLVQVLEALPGLLEGEPLSRCLVCNVEVVRAARDEVADMAPPGVLERHEEFWVCPSCGRTYWNGTHVEDMLHRLAAIKERARRGLGLDP